GVLVDDFDSNGKLDILVPTGTNDIGLYLNDGSSFAPTPLVTVGFHQPFYTVGDFNRDGKPDFATSDLTTSMVFLNKGDGTFNSSPIPGVKCYSAADLDRDGKLDLIAATPDGASFVPLLGDGLGGFTNAGTFSQGSFRSAIGWIFDVNGDARPDFVASDYTDS